MKKPTEAQFAVFPTSTMELIGARGVKANEQQKKEAQSILEEMLVTLIQVGPKRERIYLDPAASQVIYRLLEVFLGGQWEQAIGFGSLWLQDWKTSLEEGIIPRLELLLVFHELAEQLNLDLDKLFKVGCEEIPLSEKMEKALVYVASNNYDPNTLKQDTLEQLVNNGFLIHEDKGRRQIWTVTARARLRAKVIQERPVKEAPKQVPSNTSKKKKASSKGENFLLVTLEGWRESLGVSAAEFAREHLEINPQLYRAVKRGKRKFSEEATTELLQKVPQLKKEAGGAAPKSPKPRGHKN